MKNTDRAYLAGLIDGEGSLSVRCQLLRDGKSIGIQRCAELVNTNEALMAYFKARVTGGHIRVTIHPGRKPVYRHSIVGKATSALVKAVFPFLIAKRRQAELLIELERLQRNWRTTRHKPGYNRDRHMAIADEVKRLNKRGI